jgi:hypothetical protein
MGRRGSAFSSDALGLDQLEISGTFGLEHNLPARMRKQEQQHVRGAVEPQVVHDHVHPLGRVRDPGLNLLQQVDPVSAASRIGMREGSARGRTKRAKEIAPSAATVVDLLSGSLGRSDLCPHQGMTGITLRADGAYLVQADHTTARRRRGGERLDPALFC